MRISGTDWHPVVVEPPGTELLCRVMPGTFPETAVTWNDESGSNEMPQPARITVFWLPNGDHAIPKRGPRASRLLFWYQSCRCWKLTRPGLLTTGPFGT